MKRLNIAILLACLSAHASAVSAAEWFYVDVKIKVQNAPPSGILWAILYMDVDAWEEGNAGNVFHNRIYPSLGSNVIYSNHLLQGSPAVWNAWVAPGSQRVRDYNDEKYYLVTWPSFHHWLIPSWLSNWTELEVELSWVLDPDQNP